MNRARKQLSISFSLILGIVLLGTQLPAQSVANNFLPQDIQIIALDPVNLAENRQWKLEGVEPINGSLEDFVSLKNSGGAKIWIPLPLLAGKTIVVTGEARSSNRRQAKIFVQANKSGPMAQWFDISLIFGKSWFAFSNLVVLPENLKELRFGILQREDGESFAIRNLKIQAVLEASTNDPGRIARPDLAAIKKFSPAPVPFADGTARPLSVYRATLRVTPDSDVQKVLNKARPGEQIAFAPGKYPIPLVIRTGGGPDKPLVLFAEKPGTVVLTGAAPDSAKLHFEKVEGDLYSAKVAYPVRWVMAGVRNLCMFVQLDELKKFQITKKAGQKTTLISTAEEGFFWENGRLYIRLVGGQDPNVANVRIHQPYDVDDITLGSSYWDFHNENRTPPKDPEKLHGIGVIVQAPFVVLSGFRFDLAPECGVMVCADDVRVEECAFAGTQIGIVGGDSARLVVDHCEYNLYPAAEWCRWGGTHKKNIWNSMESGGNLFGVFLAHSGERVTATHNFVQEAWDAFHPRDMNAKDPIKATSEYAFNLVHATADEFVEFDSVNPLNLRIHHNVGIDDYVFIAASPAMGGNVVVDHNIFYHSGERCRQSVAMLKFDCPAGYRGFNRPTQNIVIAHNTFYSARGQVYWLGEKHRFRNILIENNLFHLRISVPWNVKMELGNHNFFSGKINADYYPGIPFRADPGLQGVPEFAATFLSDAEDLLVGKEMTPAPVFSGVRFNPSLKSDSPLIKAGRADIAAISYHKFADGAPTIGALEAGEKWNFPRPGPRWAKGDLKPWRKPLPPSFDPSVVGLE